MSAFLAEFVKTMFYAWYSPVVIVVLVGWVASIAAATGQPHDDQ